MENDFRRVATTSERIKEALSIRGKKQVDLSTGTGIDKGSISSYLSGRYEPKSKALYEIALFLNVDEMWLWGYDVPMERLEIKKTFENETIAADSAKFNAIVAKDEELRSMLKMFMALPEDKKKTVKQMVEDYYHAFADGQ